MSTVKMAPNIPVKMSVKYVNVWPNDPEKNEGKGYGPSLSLKGEIGDDPKATIYPKGFPDKNLVTLADAGVIAPGHYDGDPEEQYSIDVVDGDVTLLLDQKAGEKYPTFTVVAPNGKPVESQEHNVGTYPGDDLGGEGNGETETPATIHKAKLAAIRDLHARCYKHVLDSYVPAAAEKGVDLSLEGVSALTYQLFRSLSDCR